MHLQIKNIFYIKKEKQKNNSQLIEISSLRQNNWLLTKKDGDF